MGIFILLLFSIVLQFTDCTIFYISHIRGSIINPFIQGIWGWLFLYGIGLLFGGKIAKILITLLLIVQIFVIIILSFFAIKFNLPPAEDSIFVVLESSWKEVKTFCSIFVHWDILLAVFFSCLITYVILHYLWKSKIKREITLYCFAAILIAPQIINTVRYSINGDYERIYIRNNLGMIIGTIFDFSGQVANLKRAIKKPTLPNNIRRLDSNNKFLAILVIGESATKFHHSVYGYPRKTSPQMEKHKNNLLLFDDVISGFAHTVQALRFIFTDEELANKNAIKYSLFSVFKKAGFKILHYSNQARWGRYDSPTVFLTSNADTRIFLKDTNSQSFDLDILKDLTKITNNLQEPTLLVFHLHGSHYEFADRTPNEMKIFNSQNRPKLVYDADDINDIDEYDNSIYYTDILLGKIADSIKTKEYPAFFLYLSDHGESANKIKSRPRSGASKEPFCYEIPFMLYCNEKYKEQHKGLWLSATNNQHKPYQTDWATYSILSAARISFEKFPWKKDIFSAKFMPKKKRIMGHSKIEYHARKFPYKTKE